MPMQFVLYRPIYPIIPLHNNDSERDIREYIKNEKYQEALVVMKEDKQETHSQV